MKNRNGYSLMEMLIASASASALVAGLAGALFVSVQSLEFDGLSAPRRNMAEAVLERMMADVREAQRVPSRSSKVIRVALADRDGDRAEDTINYSWSSSSDVLSRSLNGGASRAMLNDATSVQLQYLDRDVAAQDVTVTPEPAWPVLQASATAKLDAPAGLLAVPAAAGIEEGDLLLAGVAVLEDKAASLAGPADWALLAVGTNESHVTQGLWWKVASAAEAADFSFVWSGDTHAIGFCLRISNQYAGNPITAFATNHDESSTPLCPATAATLDSSMILRVLAAVEDEVAVVGDTGVPAHVDVLMDAAENEVTAGVASRVQTSSGAVKETSFQLAGSARYSTLTVVIAPKE